MVSMSLKSRQNALTATRTSFGPGAGISTVWISNASFGAASRAATQAVAFTGAVAAASVMPHSLCCGRKREAP